MIEMKLVAGIVRVLISYTMRTTEAAGTAMPVANLTRLV